MSLFFPLVENITDLVKCIMELLNTSGAPNTILTSLLTGQGGKGPIVPPQRK
ncbi:hypothetical protein GIB67_033659 [Kingdonia uniflora]|uniref:Uncharacterized protein n=1 Tax=Kingdonia uniflora TaxID=39325 RepID=A0A7J7LAJ3_9MAGN|nr:hypothetical protein GIB67_033659 [Kingdonia uniflora]